MSVKVYKWENYQEIYLNAVEDLFKNPNYETEHTIENIWVVFELKNVKNNELKWEVAKIRWYSKDYAEAFKDYVLFGASDKKFKKKLIEVNPKIDIWLQEFAIKDDNGNIIKRNTQYNERIAYQLPYMLDELKTIKESRRWYITILEKEDQLLLKSKREWKTMIELPCTFWATVNIRKFKDWKDHLITTTFMRSQDLTRVSNWDIYIWTNAHQFVAQQLWVENWIHEHMISSLHIYKKDLPLIEKILKAAWRL